MFIEHYFDDITFKRNKISSFILVNLYIEDRKVNEIKWYIKLKAYRGERNDKIGFCTDKRKTTCVFFIITPNFCI